MRKLRGRFIAASPRHHERQPGIRQLQLRGVNSVEFRAIRACACHRADIARRQSTSDALQRVPRGDLRLPPLVDVQPDPNTRLSPYGGTFSLELLQTRKIDRLEGQPVLESRFADRFEFAGRFDSLFTFPVGPKALEADGARWRSGRFPDAARAAQGFWASAFQLAAREGNPLVINRLVRCDRHSSLLVSRSNKEFTERCDRGGHALTGFTGSGGSGF